MPVFKTRQEIAIEYGIDRKTLNRYLKKADIVLESGKRISPKDYQKIRDTFGSPPNKLSQLDYSWNKIPQNSPKKL